MGYEFHPLANIFPLMSERDMQNLVADIKKNGLLEPVVLFEGKILDGRNRYLACQKLGAPIKVVPFDNGIDALDYVLALNLMRRNLSVWQKIELGEKLLIIEKQRAKERQRRAGEFFGRSKNNSLAEISANLSEGKAVDIVAKKLGFSGDLLEQGIYVLHHAPQDELEKAKKEDKAVTTFRKEVRQLLAEIKKKQLKDKLFEEGKRAILPSDIKLLTGDFRKICSTLREQSVDIVFTDAPYGEQYLELYSDLAKASSRLLKSGGSLFVMTGQSFLPEVYHRLTENGELSYHWTIAMLLTFNNSNSIFPKKVLGAWKPIIWLTKGEFSGSWHHDVVGSRLDVVDSDEPDKTLDDWQQNPKGFSQIIEFYSKPNDVILDPMMGWGTTGVAAVELGRRFTGIDLIDERVKIAGGRINRIIRAKSEN